MSKTTVKIKWFGDECAVKAEEAAIEAISESDEELLTEAKRRCRVRTKALKNSGRIKRWRKSGKAVGTYIKFGDDNSINYAANVELNKPFLRPVLRKNKRKIIGNFKDKLK